GLFAVAIDELRIAVEPPLHAGLEILPMLDRVDQPDLVGLLGRVDAAVDPLVDLRLIDAATTSGVLDRTVEDAVEQPVGHLLGLRTGALAHEDLSRALVLAAGDEIGRDADLVQQPAEIWGFAVNPAEPDDAGRGDTDPR